jgi:glycogen debranching enzyme
MREENVRILDGSTFLVTDRRGDADVSVDMPHGLFHQDTRFLSRWVLTVDGKRLSALSTDDLQYFAARFFLVPETGTVYVDSDFSVIRKRSVGTGFHEDLTVLNHRAEAVELDVRVDADADFADLFEVKDRMEKRGERYRRVEGQKLVLGYRRGAYVRETWVTPTAAARVDERGLRFHVRIGPHGEWSTCIDVVTARDSREEVHRTATRAHGDAEERSRGEDALKTLKTAPRLYTSWDELRVTYRRSLVDLAALRFPPVVSKDESVPAAGLPWFMAVFGRDSILTSLQALPFQPDLAASTLRVLAALQGERRDDFRDEEPGKILHELRLGELTAFEERPQSPYFGAADSTPLYLVLLDEYERWTGDRELVSKLQPAARAALRWIDEWGDRDGDGYVEYERRNQETGLPNQCWKDSWNSIVHRDGRLASAPIATCEIQGYVYDAKVRCARLAQEVWGDPSLSQRLRREAEELRRRFNQDFWMEERGYFALALDGQKQQVDAITSNPGHLLWSGIVDEDKADRVVETLLGPRLFSGWGVRTLAEDEEAYNPVGYHVGTVWPHDNTLIAWGLRRYGYRTEAAAIALAMLEAATYFGGRLPEAFAGYPRSVTAYPVEYPTACSPQAWASGAPLLLLRTMLGLEPMGELLLVDPAVPKSIRRLELLGVPGRWGEADAFGRGRVDLEHHRDEARRRISPRRRAARAAPWL